MKKKSLPPILFLFLIAALQPLQAQQKPTIQPEDYGKWESLGYQVQISPNGKWLAVPIRRVNDKNELRIIPYLLVKKTKL